MANAKGEIGPDLDEALAPYSATALRAKIVDPYAGIDTGGFAMMPEDFGERLTARQLSDLVAFLLASRGSTASP